MSDPIKFGTDGWRAVIAREYTFANLERVAQAYADFLLQSTPVPSVVIGYDRRFLSELFAPYAAEVLAGNGVRVSLFAEAVPTPLISWAVKELKADGGIVITASHNSAHFNGFKIKAPWGGSAAPETTRAVEELVDVQPPKHASGSIEPDTAKLAPAVESYRQQIASYVDLERLRAARGTVIVDPDRKSVV